MEDLSPGHDGPENQPFYCHLCRVSCASALNLQSHFVGFKHKKAEEALRNHGESVDQPTPTKPGETLEDQINACEAHEPALGLEYIYEFQNNGYSTYVCKLCSCHLKLMNMFMHIVGAKHRINYLSKHHPALGFSSTGQVTSSKKIKRLRKICIEVQKKFGRQNIKVVKGPYIPWSSDPRRAPASGINYGPKSKLEKMDFTNEDFIDPKSTVHEHIVTFPELKAVHAAKMKTASPCTGSLSQEVTVTEDKDNDNNEQNEDHIQERNGDSKEDICKQECSYDPEDFTNNRELIDFLEKFMIFEESDVTFLLNVNRKLINALDQYKKCGMEDEKKKKMESDLAASNEQKTCQKQTVVSCQDSATDGKKILKFQPFKITTKAPNTALLPDRPQELKDQIFQDPHLNNRGVSMSPGYPFSHGHSTVISADRRFNATEVDTIISTNPPRVLYPHELVNNAAPGPSFSDFPMAKDNITAQFFESIKTMDVSEVVSTLNKIAATNPAFRGINVPSLVQYLTKTGMLKPSYSTQGSKQ